jgi:hypothetical protein
MIQLKKRKPLIIILNNRINLFFLYISFSICFLVYFYLFILLGKIVYRSMYVVLILEVLLLKENIGNFQLIIRYQHVNVSK